MPSKVLLIDDSVTIHRVIDLSIDLDKFEVTKVFSKKEAAIKLASSSYGYILLDNKLEGVQIFDYIKELKTDFADSNIILLVGAFDKFTEQDLKVSMADDFLVKPFDSQSLNMKLSNRKFEIPGYGNSASSEADTDISQLISEGDFNIDSTIEDTPLDREEIIVADDIADSDVNNILNDIDAILLNAKGIDEEFNNLKTDSKFDSETMMIDSIASDEVIDSSDDVATDLNRVDDIEAEFDFEDIVVEADSEDNEDIPKIKDEAIFSESKKLIDDVIVERTEFEKIADGLDIDFIEDDITSKKEDAEKKDSALKTGLSYLELDDDIGSVAKPLKSATIEKLADDTIHKELSGSVLYDEVIKPTLSDAIDVASTGLTRNKSLLSNDIDDVKADKISQTKESDISDKILTGSRAEISSVIEKAISKEFLEEKINDVLSKSLRAAIEEIVPRLAEKYILEEINRLKEDE